MVMFVPMIKLLVFLYVLCFPLYVLFTRQPDWFDSVRTPAVIVERNNELVARFHTVSDTLYAEASYPLRSVKAGDNVEVIYEASQPQYAAVYSTWGYWIKWGEILASLALLFTVYLAAREITAGPDPSAVIDQLEENDRPRERKYVDD